MALLPHLAFTSIGTGLNTLELWLDLLCPYCARCTTNLSKFLVPSVLPGGRYHGKVRLLIRPYPHPWDPQGGYLALAAISFGKAFCTKGRDQFDSALWFKYFATIMERQNDFKEPHIGTMSTNQVVEKLRSMAGEVVQIHGPNASSDMKTDEVMVTMRR